MRDKSQLAEIIRLRKVYSKKFPGTDLHHPVPRSRIPFSAVEEKEANDLILFPYNEEAHDGYHVLLWNLRIDQVWGLLTAIHHSIYETRGEYMQQWWVKFCDLESASPKKRAEFARNKAVRLQKMIKVVHFQSAWSRAFGGHDLSTAENFLKITMLFMVFGDTILDKETLFDNGNLAHFVEDKVKTSTSGIKLWAFQVLFGEGGSTQGIKSGIASILNKNQIYSP